jgi:hypothetical protein
MLLLLNSAPEYITLNVQKWRQILNQNALLTISTEAQFQYKMDANGIPVTFSLRDWQHCGGLQACD